MTLTINLATRGRPKLLLETVEKTLPNISRSDTLLMISVDSDDQPTIDALQDLPKDKRIMPLVMDREDYFGHKYNRSLVFGEADVYLAMVDYAPHLTPSFDQRILDAASVFPDKIGVIYDRYCCISFPSMNAVTAPLAKMMGGMYPGYFPFSFVDLWLDDIAHMIDRIGFADVTMDRTKRPPTTGRRDVKFWSSLCDVLFDERVSIAKKIIASPEFHEPAWRKQWMLDRLPMLESRSRLINQSCRQDSGYFDRNRPPGTPEEEARYARIKERAEIVGRRVWASVKKREAAHAQ